jgi:hypothetical protein
MAAVAINRSFISAKPIIYKKKYVKLFIKIELLLRYQLILFYNVASLALYNVGVFYPNDLFIATAAMLVG